MDGCSGSGVIFTLHLFYIFFLLFFSLHLVTVQHSLFLSIHTAIKTYIFKVSTHYYYMRVQKKIEREKNWKERKRNDGNKSQPYHHRVKADSNFSLPSGPLSFQFQFSIYFISFSFVFTLLLTHFLHFIYTHVVQLYIYIYV